MDERVAADIVDTLALVLRGKEKSVFFTPLVENTNLQPPPIKKKHTKHNALIIVIAGLILILFLIFLYHIRKNDNSGTIVTTTKSTQTAAINTRTVYQGTMVKGSITLSIKLTLNGFSNRQAVNSAYLYTIYNVPIQLEGGIDNEGTLILQEVRTEKEGYFWFEKFNINDSTLRGFWVNYHDQNDWYNVTLTKE